MLYTWIPMPHFSLQQIFQCHTNPHPNAASYKLHAISAPYTNPKPNPDGLPGNAIPMLGRNWQIHGTMEPLHNRTIPVAHPICYSFGKHKRTKIFRKPQPIAACQTTSHVTVGSSFQPKLCCKGKNTEPSCQHRTF